ncbi:MAG: hypothetical protein RLZZ221_2790 [Verrucomicrobiota bacterium]
MFTTGYSAALRLTLNALTPSARDHFLARFAAFFCFGLCLAGAYVRFVTWP